jgi:hypothetical protein
MTKEHAIQNAKRDAMNHKVRIAIVYAPLQHGEDESGKYGYSSLDSLDMLFQSANVIGYVNENGTFEEIATVS